MSEALNEYQRAADQGRRDRLVLDHLPLVRHVLGRLIGDLPPGVDLENLEAAGVLGLVEAAARFDASRRVSFKTFAYLRVRGAVLDELRRNSVFPQQVMERIAAVRRAMRELPAPATLGDLAGATGLTEDEVADTLTAMRLSRMASWEEAAGNGAAHPSVRPEDHAEGREQVRLLADAIESLPERSRQVLTLYYREDLRLKEIGEVVGLSASRVSRLLASTLFDLREWLRARGQDAAMPANWD